MKPTDSPKPLTIVRLAYLRTFRPWHWTPRIYFGVNGVTTKLLVWGWWGVEFKR